MIVDGRIIHPAREEIVDKARREVEQVIKSERRALLPSKPAFTAFTRAGQDPRPPAPPRNYGPERPAALHRVAHIAGMMASELVSIG